MSVKLLYFGNKTSSYKASKSMLETLEPLFGEFATVHSASHHKNQLLRLLSMITLFFRKGRTADYLLVDVYSTRAYMYAQTIALLAQIFKKKYIFILHGGNLPQRFLSHEQSMRKTFLKAHAIVAPSNYLKHFFDQQGIPTHYIPNIIELNNYPFKQRTHFAPTFLSLRGFDSPYNPIMTLKAIQLLSNDFPGLKLYFVGAKTETHYEDIIQFIAVNKMEKQVEILPKMPKSEWIKLSERADFMLSNPVIDNTPVSIIEGMALGLVIISTNVGGVPFLVEENKDAFLVPSNDHEALAAKMKEALSQPEICLEMVQTARKKAGSFDWTVVKNEWKQLLSKSE